VLMAILIHASFNWFTIPLGTLFPSPILSDYGLLPILGGFGVFAVVLVALTRGRLGYRAEAEAALTDASGVAHVR
jgi:uncharacterized protein